MDRRTLLAIITGAQIILIITVLAYASIVYHIVPEGGTVAPVHVTVNPTPPPSNSPSPQEMTLTYKLEISATNITYGEDVKVKATLSKPIAGLTLQLQWMEANEITTNDTVSEQIAMACGRYLMDNVNLNATTDSKGVAIWDLGTGLPVNGGQFTSWSFAVVPQDVMIE